MDVYQIEASKLHASAVLSVTADNPTDAENRLNNLMQLLDMTADSDMEKL